MDHEQSKSSNIYSMGYDPNGQQLEIRFRCAGCRGTGAADSGERCKKCEGAGFNATYTYREFPPVEFDRFRLAESHGAHFAARIRGKYEFTKR